MISDPPDLTPEQLLAGAEECVRITREVEIDQLRLLLAWADLHSGGPQDEPDAVPVSKGGPKLVFLGGDGTPGVCDLALLEMAIARHESIFATRKALAEALDLRHRLPAVWENVQDGTCPVWVARKVAALSRKLTKHHVQLVDHAVAEALEESPGRILALAEAKVIEADPAAHAERIKANGEKKGVWYPTPKPGELIESDAAGLGSVIARLDHTDALAHQQAVDDLATALAENAPAPVEGQAPLPMAHWRAEAFAMLADPAAVLAFYHRLHHPVGPVVEPVENPVVEVRGAPATGLNEVAFETTTGAKPDLAAQVFIHLGVDTAGVFGPVARLEHPGGIMPLLLSQVRDLLITFQDITVTPIIDLNQGRSVNAYEHPTDVKLRSELRTTGDVFPHANARFNHTGRGPDHDHTIPYDKNGPPGQTGDHNDTPTSRFHHRAKTHAGYTVFQTGPTTWVWGTPHGLYRQVTSIGTKTLTAAEYYVLKDLTIEVDLAA